MVDVVRLEYRNGRGFFDDCYGQYTRLRNQRDKNMFESVRVRIGHAHRSPTFFNQMRMRLEQFESKHGYDDTRFAFVSLEKYQEILRRARVRQSTLDRLGVICKVYRVNKRLVRALDDDQVVFNVAKAKEIKRIRDL